MLLRYGAERFSSAAMLSILLGTGSIRDIRYIREIALVVPTMKGAIMSACDSRRVALVRTSAAPSADQVADLIAGMRSVEEAHEVLQVAGYRSTIVGNRVAVNNQVVARRVSASSGTSGSDDVGWVVYGVAEHPAVRIVVQNRDSVALVG